MYIAKRGQMGAIFGLLLIIFIIAVAIWVAPFVPQILGVLVVIGLGVGAWAFAVGGLVTAVEWVARLRTDSDARSELKKFGQSVAILCGGIVGLVLLIWLLAWIEVRFGLESGF